MHDENIRTIVVGIGNSTNQTQINLLATEPGKLYIYNVTDFSELSSYAIHVLATIHKDNADNICNIPIRIIVIFL